MAAFPVADVAGTRDVVLVVDRFNNRLVRWRPGAQQGEVVAGGNGQGNRLDQLPLPEPVDVSVTIPLTWHPTVHSLFPKRSRELVMSMLLYFRRGALELPPQLLRGVLLPMAIEAAWITPQEQWELDVGARRG